MTATGQNTQRLVQREPSLKLFRNDKKINMKHAIFLLIALPVMQIHLHTCNTNSMLTLPETFFQCWTHSFEEQEDPNGTSLLFRPCEFTTFPAARFRRTLDFDKDGTCRFLQLAPTDAHTSEAGSWSYQEQNQLIQIFDANESLILQYKLVEVAENQLLLSPV